MWKNDLRSTSSKIPSLFDLSQSSSRSSTLLRSRNYRFNNFSHLPVITEEESVVESDHEFKKIFYSNPDVQNGYRYKSSFNVQYDPGKEKKESLLSFYKEFKSSIDLPPIININCLMNAEIKQSKALWKTSFGKRLIYGKEGGVDFFKSEELPVAKLEIKHSAGSKNYSDKKLPLTKNNNILNAKNVGGNETFLQFKRSQILKKHRKKSKKILKNFKKNLKTDLNIGIKPEIKPETPTEDISGPSVESILKLTDSSTTSFVENKHVLTDCIKSILDGVSNKTPCERCDESFSDVGELVQHNKKHELEKQVCLLCDKIFYKTNEFVQHLVNHKGVDRFICKKCKKYFPSMKKYKKHCQNFHLMSPKESVDRSSESTFEHITKWFPTYICKRCNERFQSEEALAAHRRTHLRSDLMGAYLLNTKTFF